MTKYEKLLQRAERRAFERAVIEKCYSPFWPEDYGLARVGRMARMLVGFNPRTEELERGYLSRPPSQRMRYLLEYGLKWG